MTKNEFVDRVAAESGLSKKDAGSAVESVIKSIEKALSDGEEVNFTGFGKFHVAERGSREGAGLSDRAPAHAERQRRQ